MMTHYSLVTTKTFRCHFYGDGIKRFKGKNEKKVIFFNFLDLDQPICIFFNQNTHTYLYCYLFFSQFHGLSRLMCSFEATMTCSSKGISIESNKIKLKKVCILRLLIPNFKGVLQQD